MLTHLVICNTVILTINNGGIMRKIKMVKVLSETEQMFNGVIYKKYSKMDKYYRSYSSFMSLLHRDVWEYHKGKIPKGFVIHHLKSRVFNQIFHLKLMSNFAHASMHMKKAHKDGLSKPPSKEALEKAAEWHKSPEGKKWHNKHYENMKEAFHEKIERTCDFCGKTMLTTKRNGNTFCSNKCKSAWRRESGIDNIKRSCVICGNIFTVNMYATRQTCSNSCSHKLKRKKQFEHTCINCGIVFKSKNKTNVKFCSAKCKYIYYRDNNLLKPKKTCS